MKKRDSVLIFTFVSLFLISFASAGWFSDVFGKITGQVTASEGGLQFTINGNDFVLSDKLEKGGVCAPSSASVQPIFSGTFSNNPSGCIEAALNSGVKSIDIKSIYYVVSYGKECNIFNTTNISVVHDGEFLDSIRDCRLVSLKGSNIVAPTLLGINEECNYNSSACASGFCSNWNICSDRSAGSYCVVDGDCSSGNCNLTGNEGYGACVNTTTPTSVKCPQLSPPPEDYCAGGTLTYRNATTPYNSNGCRNYPTPICTMITTPTNTTTSTLLGIKEGCNSNNSACASGFCSGWNICSDRSAGSYCVVDGDCSSGNCNLTGNEGYGACVGGDNLDVTSCQDLVMAEGFLFDQIGKDYTLAGFKIVSSEDMNNSYFKYNGSGHSSYYYVSGKLVDPTAVLKVEFYYINNSNSNFAESSDFVNFLNSTIWDVKNYKNGKYYSFHPNGETDLISYEIYTQDNMLVVVSLRSDNSSVNPVVANVAIQKYLDVCTSDVNLTCLPKWTTHVQPLVCPVSGIQREIIIDSNSCEPKIEKNVSCTYGDCAGCSSNGKCYPLGYRLVSNYCDVNGFEEQKGESAKCSNNFECSTNLCIDGECLSSSFWQKILGWFKSLFGIKLVISLGGYL